MGDLPEKVRALVKRRIESISSEEQYRDLRDLVKCIKSPYYRFKPNLWSIKTAKIDRRVAISRKWNYAYIRIPKCANSLVVTNLDFYLPEKNEESEAPRTVREARREFCKMRNLGKDEINKLIDEGFIFSVVRNPYHRVLSAYLDKVSREKYVKRYGDEIQRKGKGDLSFESFCMWLASGNCNEDAHWIPQSQYIRVIGKENVDYIEDIEKVNNLIFRVVNLLRGKKPEEIYNPCFRNHGHEGHKTGSSKKADNYYNQKTKNIIQYLYRDDFEMFGYSTEEI